MSTSVSNMLQPQAQNKCPDCLYIKLVGISRSAKLAQIDLYLTINFNEQWENIFGGRVKFGLKGGELRFGLNNAVMPYESRELAGSLQLFVPKKELSKKLIKCRIV